MRIYKRILFLQTVMIFVVIFLSTHPAKAWEYKTIFSNGFEDSNGTGLYGFNTSVWKVEYGEGDDAEIVNASTGEVCSGNYSARFTYGKVGEAAITTQPGLIHLPKALSCNLTFMFKVGGTLTSDIIYIHIYDDSDEVSYENYDSITASNFNDGKWHMKVVNLTDFVQKDIRFKIDVEFLTNSKYVYLDDFNITCLANEKPVIDNISTSTPVIKGGGLLTIYTNTTHNGVDDGDSDALYLYCSDNQFPDASNTICTGGTTYDSSPPYQLTCTFPTPVDDANHTVYCRLYDGYQYSDVVNLTYRTDSTPPSTSINNVAGDTEPTYYDKKNDGYTNITVDGEEGMMCRWSTQDVSYSSMSNDCLINGTQAICSPSPPEGVHTFYISCVDRYGNEQNDTNNLDVIVVVDWTPPSTYDTSSDVVQVPPYEVTIVEWDNIDGDPETYYCVDRDNTCTPSLPIDNRQTITFNESYRGRNYLRYQSIDDAGNVQPIVSKVININQLPVFSSADDGVDVVRGGANITITTTSYDPDAGQSLVLYVCSTPSATSDGCADTTYCSAEGTANVSCTFQAQNDSDVHVWYAFIFDSLGEGSESNPMSGDYTTDSDPPTITISSPKNTTYTNNYITLDISSDEALSLAWFCVDNCTKNETMEMITTTRWVATIYLKNGPHNVTFYANDTVGNIASTQTIHFTVNSSEEDTTPPYITIRNPVDGSYIASTNVTLKVTLDENASYVNYSTDGGAIVGNLTEIDERVWAANVTNLPEGQHEVVFYAVDLAGNVGNATSTFFVDVTPPTLIVANHTPYPALDNTSLLCFSEWQDNIQLSHGVVEHNATGIFQNSTTFSFTSAQGWLNHTITGDLLEPSNITCIFHVWDKAGNYAKYEMTISVKDATPPIIANMSYVPNTTALLDPNVTVRFRANVKDNVNVSGVVLQYRNSSSSWENTSMVEISPNLYEVNVTFPEGNYTARIVAVDTSNNTNYSETIILPVLWDKTWEQENNIPSTKSIVRTDPRVFKLGTINLTNTGDFVMNFTIHANRSWVLCNVTNTSSCTIQLNPGENKSVDIIINSTGFDVGTYYYSIWVKVTINSTLVEDRKILDGTFIIQNVAGPYLDVTIESYSSEMNVGNEYTLSASVTNAGTSDATDVVLMWQLPDGVVVVDGSLSRNATILPIGSKLTNTIKITPSSSLEGKSVEIVAYSSCAQGVEGQDSKLVKVVSLAPPPSPPPSSSGGGEAPPTSTIPSVGGVVYGGEEVVSSTKLVELVKGESTSFSIKISNLFKGYKMKNVEIRVEGDIPSRYLEVVPSTIDLLDFNESRVINITITSPKYLQRGQYGLVAYIEGELVSGTTIRKLKDVREITLVVHEVSGTEVNETLSQLNLGLSEAEKNGVKVEKIEALVKRAEQLYHEHEYDAAMSLLEQAMEELDKARKVHEELTSLEAEMNSYASSTPHYFRALFLFPQTRAVLALAKAAYERGDYDDALQRMNEAKLVFAMEKQGISGMYFVARHWWAVPIIVIALIFLFIQLKRAYTSYRISWKLRKLDREEENIKKLMRDLQIAYYKEREMSEEAYEQMMKNYQRRLAEIGKERVKLRHRKLRALKVEDAIALLEKEREEILKKVKKLQMEYFKQKKIPRSQYLIEEEILYERLAEIEDEYLMLQLRKKMEAKKNGGKNEKK